MVMKISMDGLSPPFLRCFFRLKANAVMSMILCVSTLNGTPILSKRRTRPDYRIWAPRYFVSAFSFFCSFYCAVGRRYSDIVRYRPFWPFFKLWFSDIGILFGRPYSPRCCPVVFQYATVTVDVVHCRSKLNNLKQN